VIFIRILNIFFQKSTSICVHRTGSKYPNCGILPSHARGKVMRIALLMTVFLLLQGCRRDTPPPQASQTAIRTAVIPIESFLQAAHDGSTETVSSGLESGIDCNATNIEGRSALMLAAFNGHTAIVERLLKAGAKVNTTDMLGRTALMYAATGTSADTVRLLLKSGAAVNTIDSQEHWTALMFAAAEGQTEIVRLLLSNGADRTLKDVDGDTAEKFAIQRNQKAVMELLQAPIKP